MVEIFEARRPKEPSVISEVNGLVKFGDVTKSHRKVLVVTPDGEEHEYQQPRGVHVNVGEAVPREASRWSRAMSRGSSVASTGSATGCAGRASSGERSLPRG